MPGKAAAVSSGKVLRDIVVDLGIALGLEVKIEVKVGRRIWGSVRNIDVVLIHPATRVSLGLECKFQGVGGSAEEKIPSTIQDIDAWPIRGLVNMYLIKDADGLTLIDTSIPPAGKWVINALEKSGWKASDLKRILITHAHPDHVGGLKYLKEKTGARVYASAPERDVIERKIPVPTRTHGLRMPTTWIEKTPVDQVLCEGDVLPEVMGGLHVLETPGHAPGHVTFWHPEKKIAIAGDVLFHVFGLSLPPGPLTVDMDADKRSVGRLAGLGIDILCLGHGAPIVANTTERLRQFAAKKGIKVQESGAN